MSDCASKAAKEVLRIALPYFEAGMGGAELSRWTGAVEKIIEGYYRFNELIPIPREARCSEMERLLRELCDKLDAVRDATDGIFILAEMHGMGYRGPTYEEEYKAARALLASLDGEEPVKR